MTNPQSELSNNNIKDRILDEIRCGDVVMRPKLFFTIKVAILGVVTVTMLVASILIINFIVFSIREDNHHILLGFGSRGLTAFLYFFPWALVIIDTILVFILAKCLRRFRFGYKRPAVYLLVALLFLTFVSGFILDRETGFNYQLAAQTHSWPEPVSSLRQIVRQPPATGTGICLCTVVAINGNILEVQDLRRGTSTITIVLPFDDLRATSSGLQVGDLVYIAGDEDGDSIQAFGVHLVEHRN